MLDVNRFKDINDNHGHIIGDRVLVHIGRILRSTGRGEDIVCRWAGDEFVVILPETGEDEALTVAKRIVENVTSYPWEEKCKAKLNDVSVSLGFSIYPDDATDLITMVEIADRALYAAKKKGIPLAEERFAPRSIKHGRRNGEPYIYGKREEIKYITRCLSRVLMEDPQFVFISGDMGVGKSFVVEQLESEMTNMNMLILRGRCDEETVDTPLFPFKELFNQFMAKEPEREFLASDLLPDASLAELGRLAPRWMKNKTVRRTSKQEGRGDKFLLFEAFVQFLRKLSDEAGVVLIIEEVQWADVTSLALLHFLTRTVDKERIGVILTHRPLDDTYHNGKNTAVLRELISLESENRYHHISLKPLTKENSIDMIRDLLGEGKPAESLVEDLYRITEGNPFFIKGMVEYLGKSENSTGVLDDLPPTLHGVIDKKIEKLSDDAKMAYQAASVLGREFEFDVLMNVLQTNEGFLLDIIDEGIRSNIIEEVQGYSDDRYSFVQNILCKALYSSTPVKIRAEIHLNCGRAIEKYDLEGIEERYGELAHHFEKGGDKRKTFDYTLKAARRACELYAHEEALSFYVKGIKLAQSPGSGIDEEELIKIHEERGLVYQQTNDYRRAQRDFEKVIDLCDATGSNDRRGYALKNLSNISIYKREFKKAYEYSLRTIRHAMDVGDSGLKAESLAAFGNIYLFSGEYDRALTYYDKALEMDRRDPDKLRASKVYTNLGVIYWYKEINEKALAYYQKALRLLKEIGNKTFQPLCISNIAMITLQQGQFTKALTLCEESLKISRETGNSLIEVYTYNNIGEIYQRVGDYNSALMWSRKAISLIKQVKDQGSRADFIRNRGVVHFMLGQKKKAKNDLKKALIMSKNSGKKEYEMNALYWLIRLLVDEGDTEEAKHYLVEFQDTIAHRKSREYSLKYALSSSMIEIAEDRNESAMWSLTRTVCEDGEIDPTLFMLYLYQKAEVLRRIGRKEEGKDEIEKAWKLVLSVSRKIKDKRLKEIFLASPTVLKIKDLLEDLSSSLRE